MTPAAFGRNLRRWCREPDVGLRVKHLDLVAVDLIVGVKGSESVRPPAKHKHFRADHGGRVEVPPASWWALRAAEQQRSTCDLQRHNTTQLNTSLHWVQLKTAFTLLSRT